MPRCINWASQHGQKTRNNFLADHFSFLLLPCRVRCPKVAKNGLLERWRALFSIAIGHLGAPSNISDFPIFRRAIAPSALHSAGNGRRNHRSRYRCLRALRGIGAPPHWRRSFIMFNRCPGGLRRPLWRWRPKVADGDRKRALQRSKSPFLTTFGHLTRPIPKKNEKWSVRKLFQAFWPG